MQDLLEPIKAESLKQVFVTRFEELILSGKISIGQKLLSERELALQLGVSRPVVHEGLVELAAKGLVAMKPRHGAYVNDYRKEGSLALLTSLVGYQNGVLESNLLDSLLEMRFLFEVETARLAAAKCSEEQFRALNDILEKEEACDIEDRDTLTDLDFEFHHLIAMASGNMVYPLLLTSFKQVYKNLARQFFSKRTVANEVLNFHKDLVKALEEKNQEKAAKVMKRMLNHGEEHLKDMHT